MDSHTSVGSLFDKIYRENILMLSFLCKIGYPKTPIIKVVARFGLEITCHNQDNGCPATPILELLRE